MIEAVKAHLKEAGIDDQQVHVEYFSTPGEETGKKATAAPQKAGDGATASIELNGEWKEVPVRPGKTILDANDRS